MDTRAALRMPALVITVGLSALLLFGLEPLVGRLVVPYFGGAVHVWLTCLMFFQAVLFLGYAYAHVVAPRIGAWHLGLLVLPLLVLPLEVQSEVAPEEPLWSLVGVLIRYVALPFFALSTTAVVLQSWLARSELGREREPYPLYAASNVGSLVALLGYPLVVEPLAGLALQRGVWTVGYLLYVGCVVASYWLVRPREEVIAPPTAHDAVPPTLGDVAWWMGLAAVPSAFLLATTNVIASELGSFPLVWVVPLALYLGTFIVTFREGGGVPRWFGELWPEVIAVGLLAYVIGPIVLGLAALQILILGVLSLVAHGELYERRPHPKYLTHFYLAMSFGGWVGGAVVTFGAPVWFDGLTEYPLLLLVFAGGLGVLGADRMRRWWTEAPLWLGGIRMAGSMVVLALAGVGLFAETTAGNLAYYRTFYGTYRVAEGPYPPTDVRVRSLFHGRTLHGAEVVDDAHPQVPVAYYHASQCISETYRLVEAPRRAVIGLGAGVLAGFARPGDVMHFYEIDGRNEAIAREWFTWLDEAEGDVSVRVGDGRLELAQVDDRYDTVHVDAFSGDGIPAHLLTSEAVDVYLDRLAEHGVILFHVSNRYYALQPVLERLRAEKGLAAMRSEGPEEQEPLSTRAQCVVFARQEVDLAPFGAAGWARLEGSTPPAPLWTDDYIDLLGPLWHRLVDGT